MESNLKKTAAGFSLGDFLKVLKTRWPLITLLLLLVLSSTVLFTYFMPRWYLSIAGIRVEKAEGQVSVFERQRTGSFDPYFNKEQFEIIQSKKILRQVIRNLDLVNYISRDLGAPIDEEYAYQYMVKQMLLVESRPGTSLIDIGVMVKGNRDKAAEIAHEIARVYAEDRIKFATSAQTEGIVRLKQELLRQEVSVSQERDKVEKLRQELGISGVDLNAQTTQLDIDNLRQLERTYIAVKVDSIARKTRWEQFKAVPVEERIRLINSELIPDVNLQNLMQAYMVAEQQHVRAKGRLGQAHPDFLAVENTLKKIHEQLLNQLLNQLIGFEKSLEISYIESRARTDEMKNQLKLARVDQILDAQSKMRPFEEAVDRLRDEENLLQTFRLTLRQREIDFQAPKRTIEMLNQAVPSLRPHKPNWLLNLFLAIFGGILLGVGAAFMVEFFDTSFCSIEETPVFVPSKRHQFLFHRRDTSFCSIEETPVFVPSKRHQFLFHRRDTSFCSIEETPVFVPSKRHQFLFHRRDTSFCSIEETPVFVPSKRHQFLFHRRDTSFCSIEETPVFVPSKRHQFLFHRRDTSFCSIEETPVFVPSKRHQFLFHRRDTSFCSIEETPVFVPSKRHQFLFHRRDTSFWFHRRDTSFCSIEETPVFVPSKRHQFLFHRR